MDEDNKDLNPEEELPEGMHVEEGGVEGEDAEEKEEEEEEEGTDM